jgi:hypothetical protein
MSSRFWFDLASTLSGLAAAALTQGRRWRANPGLYDSNPLGVGEKRNDSFDKLRMADCLYGF